MPNQKDVPLAFMEERWMAEPEREAMTPKAPRDGGVAGSVGLTMPEEELGATEEELGAAEEEEAGGP